MYQAKIIFPIVHDNGTTHDSRQRRNRVCDGNHGHVVGIGDDIAKIADVTNSVGRTAMRLIHLRENKTFKTIEEQTAERARDGTGL